MSEKKKFVIPILRFNKAGGFRVLAKLATELVEKGYQVSFVSYMQSIEPYYPTDARVIWIDAKGNEGVRDARLGSRKNSFIKGLSGLRHWLVKNTTSQDIIVASFFITTYPALFSNSNNKIYYIQAYEPGMLTSSSWAGKLMKCFAWFSYFLPYTRVVNADLYLNYKNIRAKHVVPPGIDLDVFCAKSSHTVSSKKIVIGCIGRMSEWKGANDVARAVKLLRGNGVDVEFKVAFHEVKMDKNDYDLVIPDGDKKLAGFYQSLDILIAPGHIQLGAVHYPVVEAMACNTSVITTGYYPADETNAYIVPIKSPESIMKAVLRILKEPNTAEERRARALAAVQEMSWDKVSQRFIDIIEEKF